MNYSIWLENECMVTKHKHAAGCAEIKVPVLPSRNNFSELPWITHMCIIFLQAPEKVSNSSYKCTGYKVNYNSEIMLWRKAEERWDAEWKQKWGYNRLTEFPVPWVLSRVM